MVRGQIAHLLEGVETVWVLERAYRPPRADIADAIDGLLAVRELVIEEPDRVGLAAQRWREGGAGRAPAAAPR